MADAAQPRPRHARPDDRRRRWRVTSIALALGTFMQVLDTTIANVSMPDHRRQSRRRTARAPG